LREYEVGGKKVVVIIVPEAPIKPVSFRGRCYKRVSSSNRVLTSSEIAELYNFSVGNSWDSLESNGEIDDLDESKVRSYMELANSTGRRSFREDWITVLKKLGLVKQRPTWASILLFEREPQKHVFQSAIRCGRFRRSKAVVVDDLMIETD